MTLHKKRSAKTPVILGVASSLFVSACSVFGVRSGTEQPPYTVLDIVGRDVEIRQYEPRLAAQVTIDTLEPEGETRNKAFSILADYIFGNNRGRTDIAMTAPVAENATAQTIAMTAPVAEDGSKAGQYTMAFFLPAEISLESAPAPNDERIQFVEMPASKMATLQFSGSRNKAAVAEYEDRLTTALKNSKWAATGNPVAYFYDPPWTIPSLRRNEIAVEVIRKY